MSFKNHHSTPPLYFCDPVKTSHSKSWIHVFKKFSLKNLTSFNFPKIPFAPVLMAGHSLLTFAIFWISAKIELNDRIMKSIQFSVTKIFYRSVAGMNLKLLGSFGDHIPEAMIHDYDMIEQLSFSGCDKYVASGDHGGRVILYRIKETGRPRSPLSFTFAAKIQAFTPRFETTRDCMSNPKVTCLQWLPRVDYNPLFVVANRIFVF